MSLYPLRFWYAGLLIFALASCSASQTTRAHSRLFSTVSLWWNSNGPTITYPSGWRFYHINSVGSSFSFPAAFLSNRKLPLSAPPGCMIDQPVGECAPALPANTINPRTGQADCTSRHTVTVCAPYLIRLASGQAYLMWVEWDGLFGSWPLRFGTRLEIDGHEARLVIHRGGPMPCPAKTDESMIGRIFYGFHGSPNTTTHLAWYEMDACLRGPNLSRLQAQVLAMLKSIRQLP